MADDSSIWVVASGCKYDGCGDTTIYAAYDNLTAAVQHVDILNDLYLKDSEIKRAYCYRIPTVRSTVPQLKEDGLPE